MRRKTKDQKTVIAYWLVPAKPERELFRNLIRILGNQLQGPSFEPHLTILSTPDDRQLPKKILAGIKAEPFHLSVRGIGTSAQYRKTMFVKLGSSKALERLAAQLRRATRSRSEAPDPHLSLLYKNLPPSARRELGAAVKLPFSQIVFDSIEAVRCPSLIRTRADVEGWRVVATKSLK